MKPDPNGARGGAGRADDAPGLRDQLAATWAAARGLLQSHIELAKAEFGEIMDEVKRMSVLVGVAVGMLVFVGMLLPIGLTLFFGEWLFGSMGWGVLHGTLLSVAIAIAAVLIALGVGGGAIARDFLVAAVLGILVGVGLALNFPNQAWAAVGDEFATGIAADVRPLVVGTAVVAAIGALLGLLAGAAGGGGGGAIAGLVGGALLGAIVGALSAITYSIEVAAGIGVTVWLLAWVVLMGMSVARRGIDGEALKARFWPSQTIDTTKETIEWVREQTPLGPRS